jgi:hypothetical protein
MFGVSKKKVYSNFKIPLLVLTSKGISCWLWGKESRRCTALFEATEKVEYSNKIGRSTIASPNSLRFPRCPGKGYTDVGRQARSYSASLIASSDYRTKWSRRSLTSDWSLRIPGALVNVKKTRLLKPCL